MRYAESQSEAEMESFLIGAVFAVIVVWPLALLWEITFGTAKYRRWAKEGRNSASDSDSR